MQSPFVATREDALRRLEEFLPRAGTLYARDRNTDRGPADRSNVSLLSPYLRHRLIGEDEVVRAVLRRHHIGGAAKFVEEICWRTYWKGWLEQRPAVWQQYLDTLARDQAVLAEDGGMARRYEAAVTGRTGMACFDAWAGELTTQGYLHNHARMWFASIWIFTLNLPWALGADHFYRHLIDGDPASNTLSWRWVAGLHTEGKPYVARAANIAEFTGGRFNPEGQLNESPEPLSGEVAPAPTRLRPLLSVPPGANIVLLLGEDDLSPERWPVDPHNVRGVASLPAVTGYGGLSDAVLAFRNGAIRILQVEGTDSRNPGAIGAHVKLSCGLTPPRRARAPIAAPHPQAAPQAAASGSPAPAARSAPAAPA